MAERIDRAWLGRCADVVFEAHLNMQDCGQLAYRIVDRHTRAATGLRFTHTTWKRQRRNGDKAGTAERCWWVDGHAVEIATLDEALEILSIIRAGEDPAVVMPRERETA